MRILIKGGTIVNDGQKKTGSIVIENDRITDIIDSQETPRGIFDTTVDATGCYVLPGVIDSHVHFREPGMTHKADIDTESRAAAYGGVTSYFEMPNTNPQTTTQEALDAKFALAKEKSHVNYSFFPGATNDNGEFLRQLDVHRVPGIKLFMGSSTGNMLVDKAEALDEVFALAAEKHLPLMAHCEDTEIVNRNMAAAKIQSGCDDPDVTLHPQIRNVEACYESSKLGVELARKNNTHFHIAHVTTAKELGLLGGNVTAEICVAHLLFAEADYANLGSKIKCNPAVKTASDRDALREYITTPQAIDTATISTDHAPHTLQEKQGGAAKAVSGMPMVQFSLPAMLTLASEGHTTVENVVQQMCHNQARLFSVDERGYIRKGYKADIAIVREEQWTVTADCIQSKCGWSPIEGRQLAWKVEQTICNGHLIYNRGEFDDEYRGEEISFRHS